MFFTGRTLKDEESFFQKLVGLPGQKSLLFYSKRFLENVQPDDVLMADDTYKIRPRINGCKHVFVISLVAFNSVSTPALSLLLELVRTSLVLYSGSHLNLQYIGKSAVT